MECRYSTLASAAKELPVAYESRSDDSTYTCSANIAPFMGRQLD
jgi:hypothetical protein